MCNRLLRTLALCAGAGLFCLASFTFPNAGAQPFDTPVFAAVDDWVEVQPLPQTPETTPDGTTNGLFYLLSDTQFRIDGAVMQEYVHIAYEVIDRAGLESGGRLSFEFDPSDTRLIIHAIRLHRDGEVFDRLIPDRFVTVRREPDLSSGIVDGDLTSFTELTDVRVGDILEYQITYTTHSEVWPGGLGARLSTQWSIPVESHHLRVIAPANAPFSIAGTSELQPVVSSSNGWSEYVWQQSRPQRVVGENNVPGDHSSWQFLSLSSMGSWADVVDWALPFYDPDVALPPSANALLERVRTDHTDRRDRITAIVRYVQDEVRYVSDSTGLGSHVPRTPAAVLANGYGDCKDKSLLLVALLRAIGVEASVALTDIDRGYELQTLAPSPFAFDHAIVRIGHGPHTVWVDATASHEGGRYPYLAAPAYHFALPVVAAQDRLMPIEIAEPQVPYVEVHERFDMADVDTDGVTLDVISLYRDRQANAFRANLADRSSAALSESYLRYYRSYYPGIELAADLAIEDDRDANLVSVTESYLLSAEAFGADGLRDAFPLRGDMVLNQLDTVDSEERQSPIHVPWPVYQMHVHDIVNAPTRLYGLPEVNLNEPFARYWTLVRGGPDSLHLEYTLQTRSSRARAEDVLAYNTLADTVLDTADLTINFDFNESGPLDPVSRWLSDPENGDLFGLGLLAGLYVLGAAGAILAFRRDRRMPAGAVLYPVGPIKFLIMSVVTFNLYTLLWMWRNWAWVKNQDDRNISAFVRAWFSPLFFPALAMEIEEFANRDSKLSRAISLCLAVAFSILVVGATIAETVLDQSAIASQSAQGIVLAAGLSSSLLLLPFVFKINALNRDNPDILRFNSRFTVGTVILLIYGAAFLALAAVGLLYG